MLLVTTVTTWFSNCKLGSLLLTCSSDSSCPPSRTNGCKPSATLAFLASGTSSPVNIIVNIVHVQSTFDFSFVYVPVPDFIYKTDTH